jgi:hypothetical protein
MNKKLVLATIIGGIIGFMCGGIFVGLIVMLSIVGASFFLEYLVEIGEDYIHSIGEEPSGKEKGPEGR